MNELAVNPFGHVMHLNENRHELCKLGLRSRFAGYCADFFFRKLVAGQSKKVKVVPYVQITVLGRKLGYIVVPPCTRQRAIMAIQIQHPTYRCDKIRNVTQPDKVLNATGSMVGLLSEFESKSQMLEVLQHPLVGNSTIGIQALVKNLVLVCHRFV